MASSAATSAVPEFGKPNVARQTSTQPERRLPTSPRRWSSVCWDRRMGGVLPRLRHPVLPVSGAEPDRIGVASRDAPALMRALWVTLRVTLIALTLAVVIGSVWRSCRARAR